jgi:hypothetical protein
MKKLNKTANFNRRDLLCKRLGLSNISNLNIPFNDSCFETRSNETSAQNFNYKLYSAICFPINCKEESHWSLLVYFFKEDYWINYDSVRTTKTKERESKNDDYAQSIIKALKKEFILNTYKDRLIKHRNFLLYCNNEFTEQSNGWECGYYMCLYLLYVYKSKGPINTSHYGLFNHKRIEYITKLCNK